MQQLLPPVRIHSWGGLGSQLFAIALAEDFKIIYPKRSLRIVLHTGGVTRRIPEVVDLFPDFEYQYIEDFQPKHETSKDISSRSKFNSRKSLLKFVTALGFLAYCNEDSSTKRLLPWVLSIRGHYSYRSINSNFLSGLAEKCRIIEKSLEVDFKTACTIHYRLGDLLTITEKNPISAKSVASEFIMIRNQINFSKLIVFSDSPTEAHKRFTSLITDEIMILDLTAILVISGAVNSKYFIGTSSKISFWIAGIRAVVYRKRSSLPGENFVQYASLSGDQSHLIDTYVALSEQT